VQPLILFKDDQSAKNGFPGPQWIEPIEKMSCKSE
jgi:hypothetical protein